MPESAVVQCPWLEPAWAVFKARLLADRMPHALLLHGPPGCGKGLLARDMVRNLLCREPREGEACGTCRSCRLLEGAAHPDLFPLRPAEGKHQIRIADVRETLRLLSLTTTISRRKVALIEPAEAMNRNAANALLKNLEEPPGPAVLLLLSHDPARLPATIRSRCQAIGVAQPAAVEALAWLTDRGGLSLTEAELALAAAGGSPRLALSLHESGLCPAFDGLRNAMAALRAGRVRPAEVAAGLAELDPQTLWLWLSVLTAATLRGSVSDALPKWLGGAPAPGTQQLARLQLGADRSRQLARTGVRKDLLLHDWLIEWTGTS